MTARLDPCAEALAALLDADWPESDLEPAENGAACLRPSWSVVLTWYEEDALRGEGWTANVQHASIPMVIRRAETAAGALALATLAARDRVEGPSPAPKPRRSRPARPLPAWNADL